MREAGQVVPSELLALAACGHGGNNGGRGGGARFGGGRGGGAFSDLRCLTGGEVWMGFGCCAGCSATMRCERTAWMPLEASHGMSYITRPLKLNRI
jgi:hypothetical protein